MRSSLLVSLAAPMSLAATIAVLSQIACQNPFDSGSDAGDAGAAAPAASDAAVVTTAAAAAATGSDCVTDTTTGATLCTSISSCPGLAVDHDSYPDCGFRINGTALDVECICSGSLCPLGTPTTCADATALLMAQSELQVCTQVSEDRCTGGSAPAAGATTTTTSTPAAPAGTSPTCDPDCRDECANAPACLVGLRLLTIDRRA